MNKSNIEQSERWQQMLEGKEPEEIVRWVYSTFGEDRVALASSLGVEDQVLTDMMVKATRRPKVFTLDTGRLFSETYDLIDRVFEKYQLRIDILFPDYVEVQSMVRDHGVNLFYNAVDLRKRCCHVRKVVPLRRRLSSLDAWITGLRRSQAASRADAQVVEWDDSYGLWKISPLVHLNEESVWAYVREHDVPYNPLHDKGFPSIGCAPCTRAVAAGEDARTGRWWWESDEKECGMHVVEGRLVRIKGPQFAKP